MTVVVVLITLFGGALFYFWYLSPWFLRTVLRMSLAGSILTLILLVLRPVLRERIPKKGQYRLWKTALAGFLVPVSLFFTIPVSTPLTGVQYAIDTAVIDQMVTDDALIEEANGQIHYLPGEEQGLGAVHRVLRTWAARALVLPPACPVPESVRPHSHADRDPPPGDLPARPGLHRKATGEHPPP